MSIQSVIFSKNKFTQKKAKNWLKKNGFKKMDVDVKPKTYRYRQLQPNPRKRYSTIKAAPGVKYVIIY